MIILGCFGGTTIWGNTHISRQIIWCFGVLKWKRQKTNILRKLGKKVSSWHHFCVMHSEIFMHPNMDDHRSSPWYKMKFSLSGQNLENNTASHPADPSKDRERWNPWSGGHLWCEETGLFQVATLELCQTIGRTWLCDWRPCGISTRRGTQDVWFITIHSMHKREQFELRY